MKRRKYMKDKLELKNSKIDFSELLKIGFVKEDDYYKYEKNIMNNQFRLIVKIDTRNVIISQVIEISTDEEFIPYNIIEYEGSFVGMMREEYQNIIENIKNNCCSKNVFKSEYSNLVIKYIKNKYNDELEYLWEKFDDNAIWRNKENQKWYGLLLTVQKNKLGLEGEDKVEIIDLRLEPGKIDKLVDNVNYFSGYHMNKKHWITIKLDGSVDINKIYELIDNSYNLSKSK